MEFNATFIVSAISFIVFVLIMNAIFYKPLQKVVGERQKFLDDTYEEAKQHKEKAEAILADKQEKLEKSKHDAKKILVERANEVKEKKSSLTLEAQKNATQKIEEAKVDLTKSKDEAQRILEEETKKLAQEISSKILGKT